MISHYTDWSLGAPAAVIEGSPSAWKRGVTLATHSLREGGDRYDSPSLAWPFRWGSRRVAGREAAYRQRITDMRVSVLRRLTRGARWSLLAPQLQAKKGGAVHMRHIRRRADRADGPGNRPVLA